MNEIKVEINGKQMVFPTRQELDVFLQANKMFVDDDGNICVMEGAGVVPTILAQWFEERMEYKALAQKYKEEGDKEKETFYDRRQLRQKIFLNSVYGTLGLPIFRFYDRDNAEATTISGQHIIKMTQRYVNMVYKEKYAAKGKDVNDDFVIYIDTDSVYMSAKALIELEDTPPQTLDEIIEFMIKLSTEVSSGINQFYEYAIPSMFNLNKHRIKITPDVIAATGFWTKKKRYALLKVYDMEKKRKLVDKNGVPGKLEVKGIDVVRTSFPARFRKFSSEILDSILRRKDRKSLDDRILEMEKQISTLPVEEVAKNTSVSFISAKGDSNYNPPKRKMFTVPTSKTPPQVGAALMYNDMLKKFGLQKQYEPIHNGQKIKWVYLRENPHALKYLAMKADGTDPDEIMEIINTYVDRREMYERELKTKIERFYTILNWVYPSFTAMIADRLIRPKQKV